ncbi:hypothetical protein HK105_202291 [Polyrhizophydium stewartii]|uniref:Ankyrin repeat protein n=1 Tax=Polyrhizophydium stewartii TaxID=2732419 RepID=A0ABR4NFX7_9FUNG
MIRPHANTERASPPAPDAAPHDPGGGASFCALGHAPPPAAAAGDAQASAAGSSSAASLPSPAASTQTQAELQLSPLYAATAALPTAATPPAAYAASASDATATPRRPPAAGSTDLYDLLVSLPFELRRQIYDETGPLTEMLHGELVQPVARSRFTRIVAECFLFNRVDVARGLPRVPLGCETLLVHSREMRMLLHEFPRSPYERLYTAFDLGTDSMLDPAVLDAASELFATIADADTAAMAGDLLDFVGSHVARPCSSATASRLLEWAAALGRLGTVKELLWHADEPSSRTFYLAGKHGHLPVIRFLCDGGYDKHVSPNGAVEGGKLGVLAWLRTRYSRQAPSALSILRALRSKAPDAARGVWILLADPTLRHSDVFTHIQDICAEAGSVEMLLFARENGIGDGLSAGAIDRAAFHGHLAMVQFLHTSTDATCSTSAMDGAAANGHLAVVEFLHAQRTEGCTHRAATSAAANGHQQILEWMIANRRRDCRIDDIVAQACDSGQYAILLWIWNNLPEDRAAFTINAAKLATRHGHFAIVDFYVRNHPPPLPVLSSSSSSTHASRSRRSESRSGSSSSAQAGGTGSASSAGGGSRSRTSSSSGHHRHYQHQHQHHHHHHHHHSSSRHFSASKSQKQSAGPGYDSGAGTDLNMLLRVAIEGGHVFLAEWLVSTRRTALSAGLMLDATRGGFLEVARWLHAALTNARMPGQPARVAGSLSVADSRIGVDVGDLTLASPRDAGAFVLPDVRASASELGITAPAVATDRATGVLVQYHSRVLEHACEHDHAHMIRFLVETCGIAPTEAAIFSAASAGSLETVEYLFERFPSMNWAGARQEALRENNQRNAYWIGLKLDIRSVALSLSNVP